MHGGQPGGTSGGTADRKCHRSDRIFHQPSRGFSQPFCGAPLRGCHPQAPGAGRAMPPLHRARCLRTVQAVLRATFMSPLRGRAVCPPFLAHRGQKRPACAAGWQGWGVILPRITQKLHDMIMLSPYDVKIFTDRVEPGALDQLRGLMAIPAFAGCRVRVMPDVHAGAGCVIGFTGDLGEKVVPNIVGVDIGCGILVQPLGALRHVDGRALTRRALSPSARRSGRPPRRGQAARHAVALLPRAARRRPHPQEYR